MENIFIDFLPPWVETGLQPAFYDKESGTVLQQVSRMYYKMNELIKSQNSVVEKFTELYNYVHDYFDNLDVQEEINNKLDEMTESGELAEIIASYINSNGVISFNTVSDMVSSENIIEGSTARTLGFNTLNDGGGAIYKIVKEESATGVDGRTKISLNRDDLYAIICPKIINVREYGTKGDGITDDIDAINYCIEQFPNYTLFFPVGTYLVSSEIILPAPEDKKVLLLCEAGTVIKASDEFEDDYVIHIGGSGTGGVGSRAVQNIGIDGGLIDGNNVTSGIKISHVHCATVRNTNIKNTTLYGITVEQSSNNNSSDAIIENCYITRDRDIYNTDSIGLNLFGSDNNIRGIRTCGYHTGVKINEASSGNCLIDIHPLFISTESELDDHFNDGIAFDVYGENNNLSSCYPDNYSTGFYYHNTNVTSDLVLTDCFVYWYSSDENYNYYAIRTPSNAFRIKSTNLRVHIPLQGNKQLLKIDNNTFPDASMIGNNRGSNFINTFIDHPERLTYKLSDPFWLLNEPNNSQSFGGVDNALVIGKWQAVALFESSPLNQDTKISLGRDIEADLSFRFRSDTVTVYNLVNKLNRFGASYQLGFGYVGQNEGELRNIKILYIKVNSLGDQSDINQVTTFKILNPNHASKMMHIPKEMYYYSTYLKEVTSIPNEIWTSEVMDSPNCYEGKCDVSKWSPSHTIKMTTEQGDKRAVLITLRYGDGVGLYLAYYDKFFKISSTGTYTEPTYSFTNNNNTLTVTNIDNSRISYIML